MTFWVFVTDDCESRLSLILFPRKTRGLRKVGLNSVKKPSLLLAGVSISNLPRLVNWATESLGVIICAIPIPYR